MGSRAGWGLPRLSKRNNGSCGIWLEVRESLDRARSEFTLQRVCGFDGLEANDLAGRTNSEVRITSLSSPLSTLRAPPRTLPKIIPTFHTKPAPQPPPPNAPPMPAHHPNHRRDQKRARQPPDRKCNEPDVIARRRWKVRRAKRPLDTREMVNRQSVRAKVRLDLV